MKVVFPGSDTHPTQVGDMNSWPVTWPNLNDLIGWFQKNVIYIMIEWMSISFRPTLLAMGQLHYCHFYPRPVLAFGYCHCLHLSVCQTVRHRVFPRNNSLPVSARITKFGPEMLKTLVKIPIVLWDDWLWHSRSNWAPKSTFIPFELVHAITHHQLKLQFPTLEQKCIQALFRSLPILGFFMYIIGILLWDRLVCKLGELKEWTA